MWETFKEDLDVRLFLFTAPAERAQFGAAVVAATAAIVADAPMVADSQRWFRHRRADVERLRDGLTLDAAGLSPLVAAAAKILPAASPETSHRYWLDATRDVQVPTTPLFGFIATRDVYDRGLALRAGRLWQRLRLLATSRWLAAQPINQPVEMVDRDRMLGRPPHAAATLAALTGAPEGKPTFAFRMGFPTRRAGPEPAATGGVGADALAGDGRPGVGSPASSPGASSSSSVASGSSRSRKRPRAPAAPITIRSESSSSARRTISRATGPSPTSPA